ncbi:hypothetical protein BJ085DRAFT_42082 [Dimargaris cristalligena]|uniref:E3 ubiquitin protein ligase n=1 Tax=Dimargaris cristalligena TaxID=215637 RepID=A0A4P9ZR74_9FUNG|nr:hypothetical protein BJ085DRAFT_42082 [Dimargaris cristalligena]|eukprot:RKP35152.1 hypothetical protein BJ085DRAFT_42082 [Dimargaris cristalligena]
MIMALKRQSVKQMEHIRVLEDKDKLLAKQVQVLEKEVVATQSAVKACKEKLEDMSLRQNEVTDSLTRAETRFNDVQRLLAERTANLEKESHHSRRLQEECQTLRRKLDRSTKEQADDQLRSERDEYKALLKCSSCSTRFKSHVITRCMHVFCNECLQARLETRQRKCPSCAEPFGANDVRKIFL